MSEPSFLAQDDPATIADCPMPRRGFDYVDSGVTWASYIFWLILIAELIVGGSWSQLTRFGVCTITASLAFVCYGYLLLRANKYRLWWRIALALVCFVPLPGTIYLYQLNPWAGIGV